MTAPPARVWRFGPVKHRTIIGPFTPAMLVGLGSAAVFTWLMVQIAGPWTVLFAPIPWFAALAMRIPVGAQTVETLVAPALRWAGIRLRRRQEWTASTVDTEGRDVTAVPDGPKPPPPAADWRVNQIAMIGHGSGAVTHDVGTFHNPRKGIWNVVCVVTGPNLGLLDRDGQEALLGQWSTALDRFASASSPVTRVGVIPRQTWNSDHLGEALDWTDQTAPPGPTPAMADYLAFADGLASNLVHEVYVVLSMTSTTAKRAARTKMKRITPDQFADAATTAVAHLRRSLAGFTVHPLDVDEIRHLIRTTFNPWASSASSTAPVWPVATKAHRGCWETDTTFHQVGWTGRLPMAVYDPTWLGRLLLDEDVTAPRTVAIVFEQTDAPTANRQLVARRKARRHWRAWLANHGHDPTASDDQADAALAQSEREVAAGHGFTRFAMFVAAHARGVNELYEDWAAIEGAVMGLEAELVPLHGRHDVAFVNAILPTLEGLD